jgi:hypothetical protein
MSKGKLMALELLEENRNKYVLSDKLELIDLSLIEIENISVKEVKDDGTFGRELIREILDFGEWNEQRTNTL